MEVEEEKWVGMVVVVAALKRTEKKSIARRKGLCPQLHCGKKKNANCSPLLGTEKTLTRPFLK